MVYVISDLHGYPFEKFQEILTKAQFCDDDELYVLGDVIDRGEDGIKYLLWLLQKKNAHFVLGNHEKMMLDCPFLFDRFNLEYLLNPDRKQRIALMIWNLNGAEPTINALQGVEYEKKQEILEYLKAAPMYREITVNDKQYLLIHSGLRDFCPDKPLEEYSEKDLLWERPELTQRYFDDKTVVFGHTPTWYYGDEHEGKILITDTWIDIDVGAGGGYTPIMLRLDDMEQFTL
ncbi:MAG: serine/threonine protein phosphatase [Ruminococcus sp.]|nr:serine/threonine protein phosphatase [Ruminococcus sp.]